ncbi:hypothetical protein TNCV_2659261 [Trichonephila clavipes]|nr:hypothetical protein TNCV_2659261 [Trichonephila clavipes]
MQPRCLKCGKNHATRNCLIKERQENPFCINCQDHGHWHATLNVPNPPQPKKEPLRRPQEKRNFASKWIKEGFSANVVSGEVPNQIPIDDKKEEIPRIFSQDSNNTSDLTQVLELFQIISNLVKKNPKILDLLTKFKKLTQIKKTCLLAESSLPFHLKATPQKLVSANHIDLFSEVTPTLQQSSNTTNIAVPDRGQKTAGAV